MLNAKRLTRNDVNELVDIVNDMEYRLLIQIVRDSQKTEKPIDKKYEDLCNVVNKYADMLNDLSFKTDSDIITAS